MNGDDTLDVVAGIGGGTGGHNLVIIDGTDGTELKSYTCPSSVEHVETMLDMGAGRRDLVAGVTPTSRQVITSSN